MEWGDFIEDDGTREGLIEDLHLLVDQAVKCIPLLKEFDETKRYKVGWYIREVL